jgi:hypothetical protein
MSKREIVAQAAERRLADMRWCGDCDEDADDNDDDDDDDVVIVEKSGSKPATAAAAASKVNKNDKVKRTREIGSDDDIIDLTDSQDLDALENFKMPPKAKAEAKARAKAEAKAKKARASSTTTTTTTATRTSSSSSTFTAAASKSPQTPWTCSLCTCENSHSLLCCSACANPRLSESDSLAMASSFQTKLTAAELKKEAEEERIAEEHKKSEEQFGFNIYGNVKSASRTQAHIT